MKNLYLLLIIAIFLIANTSNLFSQFIKTGGVTYEGNIYHTGGNIGIGTESPERLLDIWDRNTASIRLYTSNFEQGVSHTHFSWDIYNKSNLYFEVSGQIVGDDAFPRLSVLSLKYNGQVGIGSKEVDPSAIFQIKSNSKGILIPRLNKNSIINMANPANGLFVYNSENNRFMYYNGSWVNLLTEFDLTDYVTTDYLKSELNNYYTMSQIDDTLESYVKRTEMLDTISHLPIFNQQANSLLYTDANSVMQSLSYGPNGTFLTVGSSGNLSWQKASSVWHTNGNKIFLENKSNMLGINCLDPQKTIHIADTTNNPTIRFENTATNSDVQTDDTNKGEDINHKYPVYWDITSGSNKFDISYSNPSNQIVKSYFQIKSGNIYANANLFCQDLTLKNANSRLRFENTATNNLEIDSSDNGGSSRYKYPVYWDITSGSNKFSISYTDSYQNTTKNILNIEQKNIYANANFYCRELIVKKNGSFPDYVFSNQYNLLPLNELDEYIQKNKHLPGVPTATQVDSTGIELSKLSITMLEKIEELTLYTIEQEKKIEELEKKLLEQQQEINELTKNK